MSAEIVVAILGSAGFTAIAGAFVNAFFNRRKLGAEATQIITQAAAGTVENIMKDNSLLRTKLIELETKVIKLTGIVELSEQRERIHMITEERYRWHMQQWHQYCARLGSQMRDAGLEVEDPPPAWPEPVQLVVTRTAKTAVDPEDQEL